MKFLQISIFLLLLSGCHHTHHEGIDYLGLSETYCIQNSNK